MKRNGKGRSVGELGEILGWDAIPVTWMALRQVRTIVGVTATERGYAVEELFDCYRRSLVAGKPVGAERWAKSYGAALGTTAMVEMICAVSEAVTRVAERHGVEAAALTEILEDLGAAIVNGYISSPPFTLNTAPVI